MHWKSIIPLVVLLSVLPQPAGAMERSKLFQQSRTYLSINNVSDFWNRLDKMYIAELREDEQFHDFSSAFAEKIKKKSAEGKISLGLRLLYEQVPFVKGEVIAATTKNKNGKIIYQMAAAMTDEEYRESLRRGAWQQDASSAPIETVKSCFQDLEIIQTIENGGTPEEESYWRAHVNGTLLISGNREWVEKNIVTLRNETIDEPTGNKVHCHLPLAPWMRDSLNKKENKAEQARDRAMSKALGFLSLKHYLLDIEIKDNELVVDGSLVFFTHGKGLFSLLNTSPENNPDPRLLPEGITSFIATRIDFENFWNTIPKIVADFPPNMGPSFDMLLKGFQQQTGLDLGQDLFSHAGKQLTLFTLPQDEGQSIAFALELHNTKAFVTTLETLFASPQCAPLPGFVTVSDFRGRTFYTLKKKDEDSSELAFCATDSHLLFGGAALVRETIQQLDNNTKPRTSPYLQTVRNLASANAFGFGFQTSIKATGTKDGLGENEISFNYITSFLDKSYHFAEAVPGGIHHRIIFEREEPEGVQ